MIKEQRQANGIQRWPVINLPFVYLKIVCMNGRGERIRTSDPLLPKQVLYQAEPLPDS